jgi:hypothetical protein
MHSLLLNWLTDFTFKLIVLQLQSVFIYPRFRWAVLRLQFTPV